MTVPRGEISRDDAVMKRALVACCLAVSLLAVSGCSCGSDGGGGSGGIPDDFAAQLAAARCDALAACYGSSAIGEVVEDCPGTLGAILADALIAAIAPSVEAGDVRFDTVSADACVAAIRDGGCAGLDVDFGPRGDPDHPCNAMFEGTVAPGGECSRSEECEGDGICDDRACPGTCVAIESVGESARCTDPRTRCQPLYYCDLDGIGTCLARGAVARICRADEECQEGLVCAASGLCAVPLATGTPCDPRSAACRGGEVCAGTCRPRYSGTMGEACDPVSGGLGCGPDLYCTYAAEGMPGMCLGPATAGGACSLAYPDPCPIDQYCAGVTTAGPFEGTCTPLPVEGEACLVRDVDNGPPCRPDLICGGPRGMETCRVALRLGEACIDGSECASGACLPPVEDPMGATTCTAPIRCR